eukprot:TRINITY_DN2767_c0_g2_i1.p1 TRINITY_DN2767_c0_g2~~TRINITY_DN2767_c0_g2_i1.p1  ORF type:complete len:463 (-),score=177.59 TRINITY_DN2767_c0_g2_i1:87-1475(-)
MQNPETEAKQNVNNNKRKRKPIRKKKNKKKKLAKLDEHQDVADAKQTKMIDFNDANSQSSQQQEQEQPEVEIEYVTKSITDEIQDPELKSQLALILQRFENKSSSKKIQNDNVMPQDVPEKESQKSDDPSKPSDENSTNGDNKKSQPKNDEPKVPLSNRQRRKLERKDITTLKLNVSRPELVEKGDVNSPDPLLLLHIKSTPHTVAVPRHWSLKRKYLQSKRGVSKPPFTLPAFIANTGISVVRNIAHLQGEGKDGDPTKRTGGKRQQRARMRGKIGQMELEYTVLYDAFFKYQTKPKMTGFGEVYYENKEHELKPRDKIPGVLSKELRVALGMEPVGEQGNGNNNNSMYGANGMGTGVVPWAEAMMKWGLPPWYKDIKVPGVNCPPGWDGRNVGGMGGRWGDMVEDNEEYEGGMYEEEEDDEEGDEEEDEEDVDGEGIDGDVMAVNGMQTPQGLDLRKLRQ